MANSVKKYPVPLILKKILKDKMTGELLVIHDNFTKKLFFLKGRLAFASTTVDHERLGEILMSIGKITREELQKLTKIKQNSTSSQRIGEILVVITSLNKHDIYHALRYQVKVIAASTFPLTEGEWRFIVKPPEIDNSHSFKIKLPEIITEGIEKVSDTSYYKRRFSLRSPVTTTIFESAERYLTSSQMKFYLKLSNFSNVPVVRLLPQFDIPEKDFWKNIISFYLLNVVDFVEYTIDEDANRNIEEINDLYENINREDLDFYQLLGLQSTAGLGEIKASYFNHSKKYHPDRVIAAPDSTVKIRATEVFAEINRAYETLSNPGKKNQYDARGHREHPTKDTERINKTKKARGLYLNANGLYKQGRYFEASSMMEEAVGHDPSKASYYLLLGLCHSKLPSTKNRAEKCLKIAAQMEPWNADHVFALGELYKSESLMKKADAYFNKALEINMEHTLAGKAKEEMEKMFRKKPLFSLFGKKK
ncbi:MAG: DnaJ domain-containing protein [bacterium]|nr:DnaJ domain-containing protein [bacterium]